MKLFNRKILVTAGLVVLAITALALIRKPETNSAPVAGTELVNEEGKAVRFEDFRGKVVFVNNWASWCPPCIAEMPSIQNLKKTLDTENFVFVMVSFDENPTKALNFMKKKGYDFEVYFPGEDYPFFTSSIPTTYVLDADGKVVIEHTGMASYDKPEVIERFRSLLKTR